MKKEFTTRSAKETALLGKRLGSLINEKCTIAFRGGLGSGKTCFSVGVAQGLDYFGEANSPTFAIVNEYLGGRMPIYHFDMYRVSGWDDLYSTGFFDYIAEGGILACEWSENIENALPENYIRIEIEHGKTDESRILKMSGDKIYEDSWS